MDYILIANSDGSFTFLTLQEFVDNIASGDIIINQEETGYLVPDAASDEDVLLITEGAPIGNPSTEDVSSLLTGYLVDQNYVDEVSGNVDPVDPQPTDVDNVVAESEQSAKSLLKFVVIGLLVYYLFKPSGKGSAAPVASPLTGE